MGKLIVGMTTLRQRLILRLGRSDFDAIRPHTRLQSPWPMVQDSELAGAVHMTKHPIKPRAMGVTEAKVARTAGRGRHDREQWSLRTPRILLRECFSMGEGRPAKDVTFVYKRKCDARLTG